MEPDHNETTASHVGPTGPPLQPGEWVKASSKALVPQTIQDQGTHTICWLAGLCVCVSWSMLNMMNSESIDRLRSAEDGTLGNAVSLPWTTPTMSMLSSTARAQDTHSLPLVSTLVYPL